MMKHKRFPGFERCLKMMRHNNPAINEEGFAWLEPRAADYVPQLIAAFWDEQNGVSRGWLMELIGAAKSPAAMPFLLERLHDEDVLVRDWAVRGLRKLNTKEARTALWQAGFPTHPQG